MSRRLSEPDRQGEELERGREGFVSASGMARSLLQVDIEERGKLIRSRIDSVQARTVAKPQGVHRPRARLITYH